MNQFCDGTETGFPHKSYRPNKHNVMCNRKSTWDVIKSNPDFVNARPMPETPPETTFNVYRQQDERFVFVLDVSGSMNEGVVDGVSRIMRLIQSSVRWVTYEVRDGSLVGVTKFR